MSLRLRLAAAFALVAVGTAAAMAVTGQVIVSQGFARLEAATGLDTGTGSAPGGGGRGAGPRGPLAGQHARQIQAETGTTIILVAVASAAVASLAGLWMAGRLTEPVRRLEAAARAVAGGMLDRRSGLADRGDELGALGRSFDLMTARLEQAEATRRRFFQDAVHELRTPLTVIEATTSAILDGVYEHDDRHLVTIRDQARLLSRIVDDLRTISLAEAGVLPLEREIVRVVDLLTRVRDAFAARAQAAGVALQVEVSGDVVVEADEDRVVQALGALVDNALRYTPPGGTIRLRGRSLEGAVGGRSVRIEVRDTGPGIPVAALPHLFERFYQVEPGRDRARRTSGLGLAVVKALVQAHGGTVGADNAPEGGARFWIDLPAA